MSHEKCGCYGEGGEVLFGSDIGVGFELEDSIEAFVGLEVREEDGDGAAVVGSVYIPRAKHCGFGEVFFEVLISEEDYVRWLYVES